MTPQEEQAYLMVGSLLCLDLLSDATSNRAKRTFTSREGMRTVFTGIFNNVHSVTVNGRAVTHYHPAFFDNRNGQFFNSIVFDSAPNSEIVVDADWGFDTIPSDLARLIENAQKVTSANHSYKRIKSKKIEDFSITYSDLSENEEFLNRNSVTIKKYSMCNIPYILHGGGYCGRRI